MNAYQHELVMAHAQKEKTTHTVLVAIALIASVVFVGAWIFSGEENMKEYSLSGDMSTQVQTSSNTGALSSESVYAAYKSAQ